MEFDLNLRSRAMTYASCAVFVRDYRVAALGTHARARAQRGRRYFGKQWARGHDSHARARAYPGRKRFGSIKLVRYYLRPVAPSP
jgi:hypothetical protein